MAYSGHLSNLCPQPPLFLPNQFFLPLLYPLLPHLLPIRPPLPFPILPLRLPPSLFLKVKPLALSPKNLSNSPS